MDGEEHAVDVGHEAKPVPIDAPEAPAVGPSGADFIIPVLAVALVVYYSATTLGMAWEAKVTGVVLGAVLVPLCIVHMVRMTTAIRPPGCFSPWPAA